MMEELDLDQVTRGPVAQGLAHVGIPCPALTELLAGMCPCLGVHEAVLPDAFTTRAQLGNGQCVCHAVPDMQ